MSRILIYADMCPNGEYDIFSITDYEALRKLISEIYGGNCPNIGNR